MCLRSENKCKFEHYKRKFLNSQREKSDRISVLECLLLPTCVIVFCSKYSAICVTLYAIMSQPEKNQAHKQRNKDNNLTGRRKRRQMRKKQRREIKQL